MIYRTDLKDDLSNWFRGKLFVIVEREREREDMILNLDLDQGLRSYPQLDDLIKLTVFLCKKKK